MLEVVVEWSTPAGGGFVSVLNFGGVTTAAVAHQDVQDFLLATNSQRSDQVAWTVRQESRVIDPATGQITDFVNGPGLLNGVGETSGQPVSDATQVLQRWRTADVKNGRRVQGRTFLPGLPSVSLTGGNLNPGALAVFQDAAEDLVLTGNLVVWSRPVDGAGGSEHEVISTSTWDELAVLRQRRG